MSCKYYKQKRQYKYVDESTWHDVAPTEYQKGALYEVDSPDCATPTPSFKWKATYTGGNVTSAECDSSSAITEGEITKANLQSVVIGDCVTRIWNFALASGSSLTSVTIPDSVTTIGGWAFENCTSLASITIPDSVTDISNDVFNGCSSLASITIPSGVTSLYQGVFLDCTSLTSVTIGNGVINIYNVVFENCTSLTSITIPDSVTYIGISTFGFCSSLTGITIPDSVTSIDSYAFKYCTGLTSVTVNATTPPTLGSQSFDNTNNCPIYVPAESLNAYKTASGWSTYASRIYAIS